MHARNEGPGGCVPWEEAEALAEALARVKALDADDADPGFSASPDYWAGVGNAAEIASEALAAYRSRHPKEAA